jgi:hypothetical protein
VVRGLEKIIEKREKCLKRGLFWDKVKEEQKLPDRLKALLNWSGCEIDEREGSEKDVDMGNTNSSSDTTEMRTQNESASGLSKVVA